MGSLVSVIIPAYNAAHWLSHATESALGQTILDLQVIIADDGSTDGTAKIALDYGARVEYTHIEHAGLPAVTRNAGLKLARGEYIAFLDADDAWLPEKLEKQLIAMRQNNCLASSTNAWRVQPGKKISPYFDRSIPSILTFQDLLRVNFVICSSAIIHSSMFQRIGYFPESPELKAWEDYAFWLRATAITDWIYLPEPLLLYNDSPTQSIRRESVSVFEQKRRVLNDFKKWAQRSTMPRSFDWDVRRAEISNTLSDYRHNFRRWLPKKRP